jgi:hypothetical protein
MEGSGFQPEMIGFLIPSTHWTSASHTKEKLLRGIINVPLLVLS